MQEQPLPSLKLTNPWVRGLHMLVLMLAFYGVAIMLCMVALTQCLLVLFSKAPNPRLASFGGSLALYFRQLVEFLTFASDELPFPFNDWPM